MEPGVVATVKRYAKFVAAVAGVVGIVATQVAVGDPTSLPGVLSIVAAVVAALTVRQVPNQP